MTTTDQPPTIHVDLTHTPLNTPTILSKIRTPRAGALVTFAGTTRSHNHSHAVTKLTYTSYRPLALRTMRAIAAEAAEKHALLGVAVVHRLGDVAVGEESVVVAVAATHRREAWRAAEEVLEDVKRKVEVWKWEGVEGGGGWWGDNALPPPPTARVDGGGGGG